MPDPKASAAIRVADALDEHLRIAERPGRPWGTCPLCRRIVSPSSGERHGPTRGHARDCPIVEYRRVRDG